MQPVKKKKADEIFLLPRFSLKIGEWRNLFSEDEYKLMIAKALNYCVFYNNERCHDGFEVDIVGYFISRYKVNLVIRIGPGEMDDMLIFFCARVKDEIRKNLENARHSSHRKKEIEAALLTEIPNRLLFEKMPFTNYQLVALITGRKVQLHYYNPRIELMKDQVHASGFCSAIDYSDDYSDGNGPVLVTKLEGKDDIHNK